MQVTAVKFILYLTVNKILGKSLIGLAPRNACDSGDGLGARPIKFFPRRVIWTGQSFQPRLRD